MNPTVPFWKQPHIYVTLLFMVPIYFVVYKVVGDTANAFSDTVKVMVITAIVSTAIGAILGFWMGTSQSSMKKDEQQAVLTNQLVGPTPPTPPLGTVPTGKKDDPVAVTEVPSP